MSFAFRKKWNKLENAVQCNVFDVSMMQLHNYLNNFDDMGIVSNKEKLKKKEVLQDKETAGNHTLHQELNQPG